MTSLPLAIAAALTGSFTVTVLVGATLPIWIDPLAGIARRPVNRLRVRLSRDPVYRLRAGQLVQSTTLLAIQDTGERIDPGLMVVGGWVAYAPSGSYSGAAIRPRPEALNDQLVLVHAATGTQTATGLGLVRDFMKVLDQ